MNYELTVLIIDDDIVDFESIKRTLSKHQNLLDSKIKKILHCSQSKHAIELINKMNPDIVFCDYNMPVLSGLEVLIEFTKTPFYNKVPFLMLTGSVTPNLLYNCLEAGATDFIQKDDENVSKIARINSAIRLYNAWKKSEELLENILPLEIIKELKSEGKVTPKLYTNSTIMFLDFVDFTKHSNSISPNELITQLNYFFSEFDLIINQFGVERIKTIGDAYMAAAGVPRTSSLSAVKCINAALEIRNFVHSNHSKYPNWKCRIGIATGDVVGGVVGRSKIAFDIWGNTVNTASRIESTSNSGQICFDETTYQQIKNEMNLKIESCEIKQLKGLGKLKIYSI
jgi:adenylate cyclase